jgi:hypothetical protein
MTLKPNQQQITTYHPQEIIERVHKIVVAIDTLRSFDLESYHGYLE